VFANESPALSTMTWNHCPRSLEYSRYVHRTHLDHRHGAAAKPSSRSHSTACCIYWIECDTSCQTQRKGRVSQVAAFATLKVICVKTRRGSSSIASGGVPDAEFQPAQWDCRHARWQLWPKAVQARAMAVIGELITFERVRAARSALDCGIIRKRLQAWNSSSLLRGVYNVLARTHGGVD
jgi:hypothetical protein